MSTAPLRLPWRLPRAWCARTTWRTAGRFMAWGPLIGGAPYVWLLFPLPFAYAIGAGPAAVAGLLFGAWYHAPGRRVPGWPWRAAFGALAGAAVALLTYAGSWLWLARSDPFWALVVAVHGVPAAMILALTQRPGRRTPLTSPAATPPMAA